MAEKQSFIYVGQGEKDQAPHDTFTAASPTGKRYEFKRNGEAVEVDEQLAKKLANNNHFVKAEDVKRKTRTIAEAEADEDEEDAPRRGPGRPRREDRPAE